MKVKNTFEIFIFPDSGVRTASLRGNPIPALETASIYAQNKGAKP